MNKKKINGKLYNEHGPFYCPNGLSWNDFNSMIKLVRIAGNSVRVKKYPLKNDMFGNTDQVWYYARGIS